jgi:hypothetical protein
MKHESWTRKSKTECNSKWSSNRGSATTWGKIEQSCCKNLRKASKGFPSFHTQREGENLSPPPLKKERKRKRKRKL